MSDIPCRKMMPMIGSIKVEYHNKINIVKINAYASKKLMKELNIVSVPYFVLYQKGELLFSKNGMINKNELVNMFETEISKK